jgi:hypothetical protein
MELIKDRELKSGDIVQIYKNLNRDCFSIRSKATGLVLGYCQTALIADARYVVSAKGRQRVLERQVRSVHAYVEGLFLEADQAKPEGLYTGYYNPYKTETFVDEESREQLYESLIAYFENTSVYYKRGLI